MKRLGTVKASPTWLNRNPFALPRNPGYLINHNKKMSEIGGENPPKDYSRKICIPFHEFLDQSGQGFAQIEIVEEASIDARQEDQVHPHCCRNELLTPLRQLAQSRAGRRR